VLSVRSVNYDNEHKIGAGYQNRPVEDIMDFTSLMRIRIFVNSFILYNQENFKLISAWC
jgi:hypothetical protein